MPKKIIKKPKTAEITSEYEFGLSIRQKNKPPFAILDMTRSILCATMICKCGFNEIKLQGHRDTVFNCNHCGEAYSLTLSLGVVKLNKEQKKFLKQKRLIDLE